MSEVTVDSVVQYTLRLSDAQLVNSVTLKENGPYVRKGEVYPLKVSKVYPDNTVDGVVKIAEGFDLDVIFRPADSSDDVVEGTWKAFDVSPDFTVEDTDIEIPAELEEEPETLTSLPEDTQNVEDEDNADSTIESGDDTAQGNVAE